MAKEIEGKWSFVRKGHHVSVGIYAPLKENFRPSGGWPQEQKQQPDAAKPPAPKPA